MDRARYPLVLTSIVIGALASTYAVAVPVTPSPAQTVEMPLFHTVQATGRKGTRNYRPDGTLLPDAATDTPDADEPAGNTDLESCMKLWDADTHMSKAEWRSSCLRTIRQKNSEPG
jgi:hypothetical protein